MTHKEVLLYASLFMSITQIYLQAKYIFRRTIRKD